MNETRADRWREAWWPLAAAVALLAASQWLTATTVGYLAAAGVATVAALAGLRHVGVRARWWAVGSTLALVGVVLLEGVTQWKLHRIDGDWLAIRSTLTSSALSALDARVDAVAADVRAAADQAMRAPADTADAFAALEAMAHATPGLGLVVYDRGRPFAWAGRIHVPTDSLRDSLGVVRSGLYTGIFAARSQGARHSVAVWLLAAAAPADRLADAVAAEVARRVGVPRFDFSAEPDGAHDGEWQAVSVDGRVLTYARAAVSTRDAVRLGMQQRARLLAVVVLVLALGLAGFVLGAWRTARRFRWRMAAVGVALACTALVPLNAFSNVSRLFDGGLYYTSIGGALTANAGALLVTGVLVLFALLAAVRRLARNRPRAWWGLVVLAIAGLGPFLLRDLARGIRIPIYGVNTSLWLIWEVPIFLAGCVVLLAGAAAGSAALGPKRGVPPWAGPALAALSALLAPITWEAAGRWPWWYPIPWIVAVGALALARRSRAIVSSAAAVAALGATTLVWGAITRGRMQLAESDVRGLGRTDASVTRLVERYAAGVRTAPATAPSRQWLLHQYATSALAPAGLPVWFSFWATDTAPAAVLRPSSMDVSLGMARAIAQRAFGGDTIVEFPIMARPAVQFGVGIPTMGGVVVAVAASRTRLIAPDPFARLLGIDQPPPAEPPYVLQLAEPPVAAPRAPPSMDWQREGDMLRGDWVTPSGLGPSRVLATVELRSTGALVQRGVLIALVDLAIVGLLWLLSVLADGAVGRWLRDRQRRWRRSYRMQLTLALFAFFVIPAVAFAGWSYQQLASGAAQSRELLVRETLRAVAPVAGSTRWIEAESRRLHAPLFLYRDGQLAAASDSLLAGMAPIGRFLPAEVQVALGVRGEVAQSREAALGKSHSLIGFRALGGPGPALVLAAPARADELTLERRRRDLGILVLFATAVGAFAAFGLSGLVARGLAGPIRSLRRAALTLAAGGRAPVLEDNPTVEFRPVFNAFRRMATDLEASRAATAHAERVLAWGEMARQVAHEIKNPLTPIRLGVQHLQRARADARVDFDQVLDENVQRILSEIDHLDEIARAFSRYGETPNTRPAAGATDVAAVLRDLVGLERMGQEDVAWVLEGTELACAALARPEELREVLLNVFENARLAGAHRVASTLRRGDSVVIEVRDDGQGIPRDIQSRVFEPHFSTRTSGSGLGLAISRQLIEGWGGTITLESHEGQGSVVRILLRRA